MTALLDLVPAILHTARLTLSFFNRSPEHYRHLISLLETTAPGLDIHTPGAFDTWVAESSLHDPRLPGGVQDQALLYLVFANQPSTTSEPQFLGVIGLQQRRLPSRELLPPDIGWSILPEFEGKGYATEGAREVLRFARDDFRVEEVVALCGDSEGGRNSRRVAEKVGFVEAEKVVREDGGVWRVMRLDDKRQAE